MALYTVTTGNAALAADLNQIVNLLNGSDAATQVTISNRIRAQLSGATTASGYVGGTASGAPSTGAFLTGDFAVDQTGFIWVCTAGGSPGTWIKAGTSLDTTASDIVALAAAASAGATGKASDAGHAHPWTGLGVLSLANTWSALNTFSAGAALGTSPTANSSSDTSGNNFAGTAYRLAIGFNGQARQLFTATSRDDTKAVEGDILFNV